MVVKRIKKMKNIFSEKLLKWTKKDFINVVLIYLVNVMVLAGIFAGMIFINCRRLFFNAGRIS